jgi:hypothetical protein
MDERETLACTCWPAHYTHFLLVFMVGALSDLALLRQITPLASAVASASAHASQRVNIKQCGRRVLRRLIRDTHSVHWPLLVGVPFNEASHDEHIKRLYPLHFPN